MKQEGNKKALSLKTLTKSNVWDIQENDIFRMLDGIDKDVEAKENIRKYVEIIKTAFLLEELKDDAALLKGKYEKMGYKITIITFDEKNKIVWAIKKRPIARVSDLSYENITHISAAKLCEVLGRNFGGGWDSLSQSVRDIIESGFDISTTTLPSNRLHKPGGMYDKKVNDGFEVLEVPKGTWTEAIFVKVKPQQEKLRLKLQPHDEDEIPEDTYNDIDEDDLEMDEPSDLNDEDLDENTYRTTFNLSEGLDEDADGLEIADED